MASRLFFSLLIAASAIASPLVIRDNPITLPIARHYNFTNGVKIADSDRARFRLLRDRHPVKVGQDAVFPVPATNAIVTYTTSVGFGSPPSFHTLLIDTGSANTWFGAQNPTLPRGVTSTAQLLVVQYGSGSVIGTEYTGTVTLGNLAIQNQGFGIALTASGFSDVDGILGIGPADLTQGTTSGGGIVPPVTDNAFSQGSLTLDEVGISFEPTTYSSVQNGELTFGGIDSSKFTGSINYIFSPITATSPANKYVGIDQSITYGSARSPIMPTTAGITDTGTTLVLLPRDSYNAYTAATGAVADQTTGLLTISAAQYSNLQSLFFTIGGVEYEFTKNAQTFPRALNTAIGGTANGIYLVIGNSGSSTGSGLDFIDGYAFLERFYSVYSTGASQFGIATTPFTFATTN